MAWTLPGAAVGDLNGPWKLEQSGHGVRRHAERALHPACRPTAQGTAPGLCIMVDTPCRVKTSISTQKAPEMSDASTQMELIEKNSVRAVGCNECLDFLEKT